MRSGGRLLLEGRIPVWLKDVDVGGGCQVESGDVALAVDLQTKKNDMS